MTTIVVISIIGTVLVLAAIGFCIYRGHQRTKQQELEQRQRRERLEQQQQAEREVPYAHVLMVTPNAPTYNSSLADSAPFAMLEPSAPTAPTLSQRPRAPEPKRQLPESRHQPPESSVHTEEDASTTPPGPWDDPLIVASRLPTEAVFTLSLLSKGGYGEVYRGTYAGESVAIKKLLPETRRDLTQIAAFFAEVKLLASMQHAHIVRYVGVAWNALSDACVVTEFMSGGDLRAVLTQWEFVDARAHGVDKQKATIALHVAHALTYLHSLQPVVLHRDLKSKNILLDESQWLAKVTDFGVSRERSDRTMTAAVGTVLWMAPEVMVGDRYDGKADVFSFGVVLSELDTHAMPYADVKEKLVSESGRPLPDTALLQRIMTGRAKVSFSEGVREDVRALGEACVAVDPSQRPTAAQVLHRMHEISRSL